MTITLATPAYLENPVPPEPGATWGPAGEFDFWIAARDLGCRLRASGVENWTTEYERSRSRMLGVSWAANPDWIVTAPATMFGVDVKGVRTLRDTLSFTIPDRSVEGMIRFGAAHRMWGLFGLVAWGGRDIRIATPAQVTAQGIWNEDGYWWLDASDLPTLAQWLDNPIPYAGGALSRPRAALHPGPGNLCICAESRSLSPGTCMSGSRSSCSRGRPHPTRTWPRDRAGAGQAAISRRPATPCSVSGAPTGSGGRRPRTGSAGGCIAASSIRYWSRIICAGTGAA
jgi:hypothetical protein